MIHVFYYHIVEKETLKFKYWKQTLIVTCNLYRVLLLLNIYSYTKLVFIFFLRKNRFYLFNKFKCESDM